MVTKSKLKMALAAEKGVDFQKLHQKKVAKEAKKKQEKLNGGAKRKATEDDVDSEDEEDDAEGGAPVEDEDEEGESEDEHYDFAGINESDSSDSEVEMEAKIERKPKPAPKAAKKAQEDDDDEDYEEDEDIPVSDLEDLPDQDREDLIPHTRLTINNTAALQAALKRIALPTDKSVPFATHQTITSVEPTADSIEDIQDDLKRELAFYAQSLDAAKRARALLKSDKVPFSRPNDYFAEMVKDDGHMEKVKAKLVEAASNKKAAAEARKLRDLKKFGKQVQVAKLQERQKAKKDSLEKIKNLKRKRSETGGDVGTNEADLFDVGVDQELQKPGGKRGRDGERGAPNGKRQKKNEKFGFGGKKKHSKSGDAVSSGDMSSFSAKRMKSGTKGKTPKTSRLGKSRRNVGAGKR